MESLTGKQQSLINQCKAAGHGWNLFAKSVESQGWCSPKQETTLARMVSKIDRHTFTCREYDTFDISDGEAARSHDYF
jgi:hypothetical protein